MEKIKILSDKDPGKKSRVEKFHTLRLPNDRRRMAYFQPSTRGEGTRGMFEWSQGYITKVKKQKPRKKASSSDLQPELSLTVNKIEKPRRYLNANKSM